MKADFETQLRRVRLAAPSADLDRRMDSLLAPTRQTSRRWWLGATAATGLAAAILFLLSPLARSPAPTQPVVYQIEAQGLMREWLVPPFPKSQTPPAVIVTVIR
ncbi:MAG: hypothetical protein HYV75_09055 [Opitutae bacterium]|nr:hypothetical protein [Opitutae bacterium]